MNKETEVETEEVETETEKPEVKESAEATVRRAYDELKAKAQAEEDGTAAPAATEITKPEVVEDSKVGEDKPIEEATTAETQEQSDEVKPPQRWSAQGKEWFLKLPKEAQKEFSKAAKEYEGHTTKLWQELNRGAEKYKEIDEVITEYASKWNIRGVSPGQAIRQLAAANDLLLTDPMRGLDWLLKERQVTPEQIIAYRNGDKTAPQGRAELDPQLQGLLTELNELKNWKQGLEQNQTQTTVNSIVQEIDNVRNELDGSGRLKYPKLHESDFLMRVKPLVSALKETHPQLSWAEATKRAYAATEGTAGSPSLPQPRLSRQVNTQAQRAKAVSVANRSRGSAPSGSDIDEVQVPKRGEDTVRLAMQLLSRG